MSTKSNQVTVVVTVLIGAAFIAAAALSGQRFFYTLGVIFLLIATALYTNARLAYFLGSVVGSGAFVFGLVYLINEMISGPLFAEKGSDPSKMNALMFFIVFALPGAAFAISTRFGYRKTPAHKLDNQHRDGTLD